MNTAAMSVPDSSSVSCIRLSHHPLSGLAVLIVGGQRIIRHNLQVFLESCGCSLVQVFPMEDQTLLSLDKTLQSVDVIILMPAAGKIFSTFHQIQQVQSHLPGIPLLILSPHLNRAEVYAAMRIGARGYLSQDADPAELIQAIQVLRGGKSYVSSDVSEILMSDLSAAVGPARSRSQLPPSELTPRELEIVQLLCEALSSKQVARRLNLSTKTIENHRCNIYRKCGVDSAVALFRYAVGHGIVAI